MKSKRTLMALFLSLLMLVLPVGQLGVVAEEEIPQPIEALTLAGNQLCADDNGEYALRFGFDLYCAGVTMDENYNTVIADDATVTIDGVAYPLVGFGTRMALSRDRVDRVFAADVTAEKLYSVNDDGTVTFTARVVGMTKENLKTLVYAKGYVTYLDGDEVKTYTTAVYDRSYEGVYIAANFPKAGDVVHDYLALGDVTVDLDNGTGTMVVKNVTKGWECDQAAFLQFTCYDAAGNDLGTVRVNIGRIHAGRSSTPLAFTMKPGTASMRFKSCSAEFWTDGWH